MFLTERSKSENSTYCVIPTLWHSKKDKSMKTIKKKKEKSVVARDQEEGEMNRQNTEDLRQ